MFRKLMMLFALALALVLAPVVHAQTVDEILAKHYEAMGGLAKLKAINSSRVTGTMAFAPGMEAPFTMETKRPGRHRVEFTIQGMIGVQAFDGEKSWSVAPFMGKKDPEYGSEEENKAELDAADFDGVLIDWKAKGHAIELVGKESIEGADTFKLKVTKKNGNIEYYYLDAETYLLVKKEGKVMRQGAEIDGETTFSDYKDVDGTMQAFSMETGAKGSPQKRKMSFGKIELNVPLDDARFAMPGAAVADTSGKRAPKTDAMKDGDAKPAVTAADSAKGSETVKKAAPKATTKTKKKKD